MLLALVDANCKLLYADIGQYGSARDGSIFSSSTLRKMLDSNHLNLPVAEPLEGTEFNLPYYILADSAFPLEEFIMKPFTGKNLPKEKKIYNYRFNCQIN